MLYSLSDIRTVWTGPQRPRFESVFRDDLLRVDPALCDAFLGRLRFLIDGGASDTEIYRDLRRFYCAHEARFVRCNEVHKTGRAARRMEQIKKAAPSDLEPKKILDVGSGTGLITSGLSDVFGIAADHVYGLDPFEPEMPSPKFRYLAYDAQGNIPVPEGTFNLITALMVFHHAQDSKKLLAESYRVLSAGGIFLVRETDAATADDVVFNSVMDRIFYSVFDSNDHLAAHFNFRSASLWQEDFEQAGFVVRRIDRSESHQPYSPTWFVLEKRKPVVKAI